MQRKPTTFYGKYRFLIFAIAIFFILSVGIFGLNFFLSSKLSEDGSKINDSGKLRGLTQQNAKSILSLAQETAAGEPIQTSQAEISESLLGLNETLERARVRAVAAADQTEIDLIAKFDKTWQPLALLSSDLVKSEKPDDFIVDAARKRSGATNVRLLQIADDLTGHLESVAAKRANELKLVQAAAILLASINFLIIVVYAFRSLKRSDQIADAAKRETEQILGTVREGLFLIDGSGTVGSQRSAQLDTVFPRPLTPGANLLNELEPLVTAETLVAVRDYLKLLFNKRVKASLVKSLNPLNRVEIFSHSNAATRKFSTFLNFEFSPVTNDGDSTVTSLLVSIVDVSQEVYLERELESAEQRANSEMAMLLGVLENDPAVVAEFLFGATKQLNDTNAMLRVLDPKVTPYREVIDKVFRTVHAIKGEAAAMALGPVSQAAHSFEDVLVPLRQKQIAGEDLIPVATGVAGLQLAIEKIRRITDRLASYAGNSDAAQLTADEDVHQTVQRVQRLALAVAADLSKRIRVEVSLAHLDEIPESVQRLLHEGLPQLVRNAVVHGIETEEERIAGGKSSEGLVRIEMKRSSDGQLELVVFDDGRGIDVTRLRSKLVLNHQKSAQEVAAMSDRQVVGLIFEPGVSTSDEVTEHAGRGVGLDVLLALARETGAKMRVASTPNRNTRFTLQWSATA
ncbi:MAG: Hpt domain-containing protein [Rhodocyclaceae bacterium]|nr:Hpt domain-containing protein [Rhodocyclaceae bacterium]